MTIGKSDNAHEANVNRYPLCRDIPCCMTGSLNTRQTKELFEEEMKTEDL